VVEIFIDPDRSGRDYAELEISPANVVCDLRLILPWPDMKQDFAWDIEGLETRVVPRPGARAGAGDWTATALLPWAAFRSLPSASSIAVPPRPGDRWRFNLFRIKRPGGPADPGRDAVFAAWSSPGKGSFHVPEAFRDLVFEAPAPSPAR
ncbi:MAG TPA: carbohydrate-binding family 9-like protein, partial [Vicinamibacterales bacterium]|nr:carbohydrate-binding family 9-like protein [Vicinamibacterales bacterium]